MSKFYIGPANGGNEKIEHATQVIKDPIGIGNLFRPPPEKFEHALIYSWPDLYAKVDITPELPDDPAEIEIFFSAGANGLTNIELASLNERVITLLSALAKNSGEVKAR